MPIPVSVIILTKNEEQALPACLQAVSMFAQVIVVDSFSSDCTREIAAQHGAQVVMFEWNGTYPKKKQWSMENAPITQDFVLLLDADEIVTPNLAAELQEEFRSEVAWSAAKVRLEYQFLGKTLRFGHQVHKLVLFRVGCATFPVLDDLAVSSMWEVEGHYQPIITGNTVMLTNRLHHHDPDPLYDYFGRHNRYSDWEAHLRTRPALRRRVAETRTSQGKVFDMLPFKPVAFFIYAYVLKQGFRDGAAGLNYAIALSFYYWQIFIKQRELERNGKSL